MAYAYTQAIQYGTGSDGWVKFNVSPATPAAVGETVTVSGRIYDTDGDVDNVALYAASSAVTDEWGETVLADGAVFCAEKAVSVPKGTQGAFSVSFTVTEETAQLFTGTKGSILLDFRLTVWGSHGSTEGYMETKPCTALTLLKYRAAPVIETAAFSDEGTALSLTGCFVQGRSLLRFDGSVTTDPDDDSVSVKSRVLTVGGCGYSLSEDGHSFGAVTAFTEDTPWTYTVTDSKGLSAMVSGSIRYLPYAAPSVTAFSAERYRAVTAESGDTEYVQDDDSPLVRIDMAASVSALNGCNAWTATVSVGGYTHAFLSGADGQEITLSGDRDAVDTVLSETENRTLTLTLTDLFETCECTAAVSKAGGILNIEKTGVAVGKRSAGSTETPLFEVAYPAEFKSRVTARNGYRLDYVSSRVEPGLINCAAYSDADTPYLRRIGYVVYWGGAIKLNSALAAGSSVTIRASLGAMYCPFRRVAVFTLTTGGVPVEILIGTDGQMRVFNRGQSAIPNTAFIPLTMCYTAEYEV